MDIIHSTKLTEEQKKQLRLLWNNEYPASIGHKTLESLTNYLKGLEKLNHYLLVDEKKDILGWFFDFERDKEKQFAIILSSIIQGKGYGKKLLELAKSKNDLLCAWVVDSNEFKKANGDSYNSPLEFYVKNGFEVLNNRWDSETLNTVKIRWQKDR